MLFSHLSNIINRALQWYSMRLDMHPLTTKCITSGLVSGSGDVLCQAIVHRSSQKLVHQNEDKFKMDKMRTFRFILLG